MRKILTYIISICFLLIASYFILGFYVAYQILKIDFSCGLHEGSLPNNWSTDIDAHEYKNISQRILI